MTPLTVSAPSDDHVLIRNVTTGETFRSAGSFAGEVPPGEYEIKLKERGGPTVRRAIMTALPGEAATHDIGERPQSRVREALLRSVPHDSSQIFFSETLGPMSDADVGVWLSIIGASRIVRDYREFSKLRDLPIETFEDVQPGASAVYALLALESPNDTPRIAISQDAQAEWRQAQPVEALGIWEHRHDVAPAPYLFSIRVGDGLPLTVASMTLRDRATLIVVCEDDGGGLRVHQYILPFGKLLDQFDPFVRSNQPNSPLAAVRVLAAGQKQLIRNRELSGVQEDTRDDVARWENALSGKWLDPVAGIMASYELIRTGRTDMTDVVLDNLRRYFSDLPDVEAIARLAGRPYTRPSSPPLFVEGLIAFDHYETLLPLPENKLTYGGLWTSWLGAVE
jgi:hypothetical protein